MSKMALITNAFLISHGANAIFAAILVFVILYRYKQTGIRLLLLMAILMGSWMVTNTLLILPLILNNIGVSDPLIGLIASWNIIGSAIVPSVFIIFIDSFEGTIEQSKTSAAMLTLGAAIFISLAGLSSGDLTISSTIVYLSSADLITMRWSPLSSLAIFPTVIICGIWTQKELNKTLSHAVNERQIKQLRYIKLGSILMFFIGPAFGILGVILVDGLNYIILGTWASEIVGYLFVSIGIFIVSLSYTTSEEVAFLQPQRMDSLLVIYNTGIPVFDYNFHAKNSENAEISLVSGAITAITALMGEAFNVSSDVKEIDFHDKELLLEFQEIDEDLKIAFILISDRGSDLLRSSLENFANNFVKLYSDKFQKQYQIQEEQQVEVENLVRSAFGLAKIK